jgi:hypothetical protein
VSDKNEESPFGRVIIEQLAEPDVDLSDVEIKSSPPWRLLVSLERRVMPTSPPSVEYSLNDLGRRLVPAIEASAAVSAELKARQSQGQRMKWAGGI